MGKQSRLRTKQDKRRRPAILFIVFLIAVGVFSWNHFDVQDLIRQLQTFFHIAQKSLDAGSDTRGTIYDRNYKEIAVSLEKVTVYARMREIESLQETAAKLSSVLRVDDNRIMERLQGDSLRTWVVQNISRQQEEAVRKLKMPGIFLTEEKARFYPQEESAAHLVGFVEADIGLAGIEYYYDSLLSRHSSDREENTGHLRGFPHLVLTLDLKIQGILEKLVEDLVFSQPDVRAGAFLMEAGTGAIVASVQYPSFNPNNFRQYSEEILSNLFLEPLLLPVQYRRFLRDAALLNTQNEVTGAQLPWSLVAGGESLGSQLRLWDRIGLNESPSSEFIEEDRLLATKDEMREISGEPEETFDSIPELLSPLQLMTAATGLLNGGKKVRATAVSQLLDPETKKEYPLPGKRNAGSGNKTVSPEASREILRMLADQSKKGHLDSISFQAENLVSTGRKSFWSLRQNRLLLSVIPSDQPELVLLVVLETPVVKPEVRKPPLQDPVAAFDSVVRRIAVLQQVGMTVSDVVSPGEAKKMNYTAAGVEAEERKRGSRLNSMLEEGKVFPMPDLQGFSLRKALRLLQGAEVRIRIVGAGKVTAQSPKPGEALTKNSECLLTLQKEEDIDLQKLEKKQSVKQ
jgi:cell division protein FtsI (penicillin-binding protein 3)